MVESLIPPRLTPYVFASSSIKHACYVWLMPKSNARLPVIMFSGILSNNFSSKENVLYMQWRCEELIELVGSRDAIVIDCRQLRIESPANFDQILSKLVEKQKLVQLIVNPESLSSIKSSCISAEISTDYETVFSSLAFNLKRLRFDQGKTMMEPRKVQSLRFLPVSLDISSIECESYTWRFQQDNRDSGYIQFRGSYRHGSAGREDAIFIDWRLDQFCEAIRPKQLILDMRYLSYEWGDDINLYPPDFCREGSPIRFLLKPEQMPHYQAVIFPEDIDLSEEAAFQKLASTGSLKSFG